MRTLIRALADEVAPGIIVACDEDGTIVTLDASAAQASGSAPHHLSVVATLFPGGASIGVVIVVLLLIDP